MKGIWMRNYQTKSTILDAKPVEGFIVGKHDDL